MNTFSISFIIGLFFGLLAGIMAFVITYGEYLHHFSDKKKILRHALETGFVTFAIFLGMAMLAGFILGYIR
jgi:K+-sensing histidine kinase KdpD